MQLVNILDYNFNVPNTDSTSLNCCLGLIKLERGHFLFIYLFISKTALENNKCSPLTEFGDQFLWLELGACWHSSFTPWPQVLCSNALHRLISPHRITPYASILILTAFNSTFFAEERRT